MRQRSTGVSRLGLGIAVAACLGAWTPASGQDYELSVIARGLERPTGIAVHRKGNVYFTQLPTPGVNGDNGGSNRVMRLHRNGNLRELTFGEPEPTHIAVTKRKTLYWTCKSAGVILTFSGGERSLVLNELEAPSGIAVADRGPAAGERTFTQIPTPGVNGDNGGRNRVSVYDGNTVFDLSSGEPEPTDVAVDDDGTTYWTCTSAGVILYQPRGGERMLLLRDLNLPSGIAVDREGHVYFTELPTPGVPGDEGGMNRIWRHDPDTGETTLIHEGDPDPVDVAVTPDGATVYWTCRSAGVIVAARRQ